MTECSSTGPVSFKYISAAAVTASLSTLGSLYVMFRCESQCTGLVLIAISFAPRRPVAAACGGSGRGDIDEPTARLGPSSPSCTGQWHCPRLAGRTCEQGGGATAHTLVSPATQQTNSFDFFGNDHISHYYHCYLFILFIFKSFQWKPADLYVCLTWTRPSWQRPGTAAASDGRCWRPERRPRCPGRHCPPGHS